MTKETISAFTLKITSSNKSQLINIVFEIYKVHEAEALEALESGDIKSATHSISKLIEVVNHLQKDLDFKYDISKELNALYDFVQRSLAKAIYQAKPEVIYEARVVMDELSDAFMQIAALDSSEPLMRNTQSVVAGYTYGRTSLNESFMNDQTSRGFWA